MKITSRILSIPPYLSTTWNNISSLYIREGNERVLVILLKTGEQVDIPGLDKETIDEIFEAHAKSTDESSTLLKSAFENPFSFSLPLKSGGIMEGFETGLQHNPDQADAPLIKPEILKKIVAVTKAFGMQDLSFLTKAEPHCNCTYCQLARSLHGEETLPLAEEVSEEDLRFRDWDVTQNGNHLYTVTSPLDPEEHYSVFLGEPLGCTCGSKTCEHIRAVLNS